MVAGGALQGLTIGRPASSDLTGRRVASETGLEGADDAVFAAVEGEGGDGGAACRGDALEETSRPAEVMIPTVSAGMEEWRGVTGLRVFARLSGSLAQGAMDAGEGKVGQDGAATRSLGRDVVYMKGGGLALAGESAVFAAVSGTVRHATAQCEGHRHRLTAGPATARRV